MDYTIIERAGLTQQEAADLLHIARVTLNLHINGKNKPMPTVALRTERVFALLERLVEAKKLPKQIALRDKAARAVLMAKLHTVIEKHLATELAYE